MTSLSPNSAENFEDQGGRRYVFSMYIKISRDISTYILTRYRFYNDGFIVKPQPRAKYDKKRKITIRASFSLPRDICIHEKNPRYIL